jgi:hypothetical protein
LGDRLKRRVKLQFYVIEYSGFYAARRNKVLERIPLKGALFPAVLAR